MPFRILERNGKFFVNGHKGGSTWMPLAGPFTKGGAVREKDRFERIDKINAAMSGELAYRGFEINRTVVK